LPMVSRRGMMFCDFSKKNEGICMAVHAVPGITWRTCPLNHNAATRICMVGHLMVL
jgi:hypothetical protein